jgi:multimeric flavodoxin WrbA
MKALIVNCTLKPSPATSNTEALAAVLATALREQEVEVETVRAVNRRLAPGVSSDEGEGDEWPSIHAKLLAAEILIVATPTWLGRPSSIAQRVLERMDAMLSEEDDEGRRGQGAGGESAATTRLRVTSTRGGRGSRCPGEEPGRDSAQQTAEADERRRPDRFPLQLRGGPMRGVLRGRLDRLARESLLHP